MNPVVPGGVEAGEGAGEGNDMENCMSKQSKIQNIKGCLRFCHVATALVAFQAWLGVGDTYHIMPRELCLQVDPNATIDCDHFLPREDAEKYVDFEDSSDYSRFLVVTDSSKLRTAFKEEAWGVGYNEYPPTFGVDVYSTSMLTLSGCFAMIAGLGMMWGVDPKRDLPACCHPLLCTFMMERTFKATVAAMTSMKCSSKDNSGVYESETMDTYVEYGLAGGGLLMFTLFLHTVGKCCLEDGGKWQKRVVAFAKLSLLFVGVCAAIAWIVAWDVGFGLLGFLIGFGGPCFYSFDSETGMAAFFSMVAALIGSVLGSVELISYAMKAYEYANREKNESPDKS